MKKMIKFLIEFLGDHQLTSREGYGFFLKKYSDPQFDDKKNIVV